MGADYVAHVEANPYTAPYEAPGLQALMPLVDAGDELLRLARARLPAASFVRGDLAEPLPFEDGSFDLPR